jgi:hypothetical protein
MVTTAVTCELCIILWPRPFLSDEPQCESGNETLVEPHLSLSLSLSHTHTHTNTHAHIHSYTRTHTHIHTHTRIRAHTHTHEQPLVDSTVKAKRARAALIAETLAPATEDAGDF